MTTFLQIEEQISADQDGAASSNNAQLNAIDSVSPPQKAILGAKTASKKGHLHEKHFQQCTQERGLFKEWIEINCRSVDEAEATQLLGYTAKSKGIWLQGDGGQGQLRPDRPWRSEGDKKAPKYRTPIGGFDIMLPIHPEEPNYWVDLEALKIKCYTINGHPCLLLTEGFFKAIAGCSNDIPTIALLGVEMGLTASNDDPQGKRYLVDGLEKFARAGFGFIIGFDADCATNNDVLKAQQKLGCQLKKFHVPVYVVTGNWAVGEGKGMDDYIQRNGADAFRKYVMLKATNFETWERQFRDLSLERKNVSQASLSKEIAEKYKDKIAWHVKNKAWYWYEAPPEYKKGVWSEIPEEVIGSIVFTEAELKIGLNFKHDLLSGIIRMLKYHLREVNWKPQPGYVCLQDCVIDVATLQEYPHDPSYKFLSGLPYKWRERSRGCDLIKQWLLEICEGREEWVQVLRAAMKATVTEIGKKLQRYIEIIGPGGTGKSTIIGLVKALVGEENVAVTKLKQMENNRFETASFYGKKAILISDSERYGGDVDTLKAITGGDLLRYEKKGVQQTSGFVFWGLVWLACNEPIQSTDYTSGLKRRRLSMLFNRVVPPHLRRNLEQEFLPYLPGLLQWVLEMPDEEVVDYLTNTEQKVPSLASFSAEILLETKPTLAIRG
jgi:putative DNA primase/helicase